MKPFLLTFAAILFGSIHISAKLIPFKGNGKVIAGLKCTLTIIYLCLVCVISIQGQPRSGAIKLNSTDTIPYCGGEVLVAPNVTIEGNMEIVSIDAKIVEGGRFGDDLNYSYGGGGVGGTWYPGGEVIFECGASVGAYEANMRNLKFWSSNYDQLNKTAIPGIRKIVFTFMSHSYCGNSVFGDGPPVPFESDTIIVFVGTHIFNTVRDTSVCIGGFIIVNNFIIRLKSSIRLGACDHISLFS